MAVSYLSIVGKAAGTSEVVGPGICFKSPKRQGVILAQRWTWVLYAYTSACTIISKSGWGSVK